MRVFSQRKAMPLAHPAAHGRALGAFALAACAGLLAGCAPGSFTPTAEGKLPAPSYLASAADTFTSVSTPGNTAYKIGPQDVIEISVFKVPELSRTVQVADPGTVNLPLVGEVKAVGRTAQELEQDLTKKLGAKYLQKPQVTIYVKEFNSQRVTIEGSVKKPGVYPLRGKTSLLQFIAIAEGLNDTSDSSNIVVFRRVDGRRSAAKFDLNDIRSGQADDPAIEQGDVIVANASQYKAVLSDVAKALPVANVFVPFL